MVVLVHPFRPLIRKLPDGINSGNGASIAADSIQRWRNNESDGVGLGIVAALEKAGGGGGGDPLVKLKFRVTAPIPIVSPRAARDFLSHCCLCRKELHGKDIYMYRGEKAFCSMECRYKQMVSDEYQEKCGSEVAKKPEISVSPPYTGGGRLFFTGIVVR